MIRSIEQLDIGGKRLFIRVDFNVPLDKTRKVKDDARIRAALPTIRHALSRKAKVMLASHLGRHDGKFVKVFSWYDNEWGFSNRMVDVGLFIAGKL